MSQGSKIFTGFLSFIPVIMLIVFLSYFFQMLPRFIEWGGTEPDPTTVFETIRPIFIWGILMGLSSLGLLVFFIVHLIRNKQVEQNERIIWILVFIFAGMVGYPIYWFMRIWSNNS